MSEVIAQVAPVLAYIAATFVLYRLLVKSKEAQIETLKEQIGLLKEQLAVSKENSTENLLLRHKEVLAAQDDLVARAASDRETSAADLAAMRAEADNLRQQVANLVHLLNNPPTVHFGMGRPTVIVSTGTPGTRLPLTED